MINFLDSSSEYFRQYSFVFFSTLSNNLLNTLLCNIVYFCRDIFNYFRCSFTKLSFTSFTQFVIQYLFLLVVLFRRFMFYSKYIYWLSNSEKSRILFFNSKFFCKGTGKQPKVYAFVSWIALNKLFFDWAIISVYIFWQVNINSCIILCILCRWNLRFLGVNIFNIFPAKSSGFLIALLYYSAGNSCYEQKFYKGNQTFHRRRDLKNHNVLSHSQFGCQ